MARNHGTTATIYDGFIKQSTCAISTLVLCVLSPAGYPYSHSNHHHLNNGSIVYSEKGDITQRNGVRLQQLKATNRSFSNHLKSSTPIETPTVASPNVHGVPENGIVVNVAEQKLYYYPKNEDVVMVFPVGVGKDTTPTPVGVTRVIEKQKDPTWFPPKSIRERLLAKGIQLPEVMGPGPENPLGKYALRLSIDHGQILIHGTDAPWSIGTRASSGCIRMLNEHVEQLYKSVPLNTPVYIVNVPPGTILHQEDWTEEPVSFNQEYHPGYKLNNSVQSLSMIIESVENYEPTDPVQQKTLS